MKPNPFDALNHFTVPCSFTLQPRIELLCRLDPFPKESPRTDREAVNSLIPQAPSLPVARKNQSSEKQTAPLFPPARGNTRATNAMENSTIKRDFCPCQRRTGARCQTPYNQLIVRDLFMKGRANNARGIARLNPFNATPRVPAPASVSPRLRPSFPSTYGPTL